jgi:hypothetical protein
MAGQDLGGRGEAGSGMARQGLGEARLIHCRLSQGGGSSFVHWNDGPLAFEEMTEAKN